MDEFTDLSGGDTSEMIAMPAPRIPPTRWTGPAYLRLASSLLTGLYLAGLVTPATARAADPFLVIAEQTETQQPLDLPSISPRLQSFEQVTNAISTEQRRIAELETRLQQ